MHKKLLYHNGSQTHILPMDLRQKSRHELIGVFLLYKLATKWQLPYFFQSTVSLV